MTAYSRHHQEHPIYPVRKLLRGDEEFVGNSHWASNCEDCQEDVKIERDPVTQFPLSYQCDKNPQWVTSSTMVQFDYEVATAINSNQDDNVLAMQWSLLEQVAEWTGLSKQCNFDYQFEDASMRPRNGNHQRRRSLNQALYYPTTIYGIRSLPKDRPGEIGDCNSLSYDSKTSECFPVTAIMTVKYRGEPQDAVFVQEYIKSVIKEQMETGPSKFFVQDVTNLGYVGERIQFTKPNDATRIKAKQTLGIAAMTTIVSLSTLLCLGIAIVMMRNKKERTSSPSVKITNLPFDLEECSTDSFPGRRNSSSDDNDEYDVPLTLMASTEEMELPPENDAGEHWTYSLDARVQDLPPPPIQLQLPPIGRPLKVQRKRKGRDSPMRIRRSSSFSTLQPISETNSELDDDDDNDSNFEQMPDVNLSFDDEIINETISISDDVTAVHKDFEFIMDEIFFNSSNDNARTGDP
ncbi:unnamed protein product [Cylindrotheca closterium]|uniref:Uncharacterized protein n=1 Tax=Cylindrotheca closterium TaxID=2856 RepID=A0AAD2FK91_9STRA|nr:unnamed protein product [Cylindrotheca closterium]